MDTFDKNHLIDISKKEHIAQWCTKLNCEEADLIRAVMNIGPHAGRVNDYLELNRKKKSK